MQPGCEGPQDGSASSSPPSSVSWFLSLGSDPASTTVSRRGPGEAAARAAESTDSLFLGQWCPAQTQPMFAEPVPPQHDLHFRSCQGHVPALGMCSVQRTRSQIPGQSAFSLLCCHLNQTPASASPSQAREEGTS